MDKNKSSPCSTSAALRQLNSVHNKRLGKGFDKESAGAENNVFSVLFQM